MSIPTEIMFVARITSSASGVGKADCPSGAGGLGMSPDGSRLVQLDSSSTGIVALCRRGAQPAQALDALAHVILDLHPGAA